MQDDKLHKDRKNRRKPSIDLSTMVYGKIPPQARQVEEDILGACLLFKEAFGLTSEILKPQCFYVDANQRIFNAMVQLSYKNSGIDLNTVVQQLLMTEELESVGGPYAISKLTNNVKIAGNLEDHCKIVWQKFIQRELIRISGEIIGEAYEDTTDVFDLLNGAESKLSSLLLSKVNKPYAEIKEFARPALDRIYERKESPGIITGVPTGYGELDAATMGWQPSSLIVIAARPGVGKSAIAANLALNAASHKVRPTGVGIFSLEMSSLQWYMRMLCSMADVDKLEVNRGNISTSQLIHIENIANNVLSNLNILFDDSADLDLHQLKSKARKMVTQGKVGMLIVDYLQLMTANVEKGMNREQEVAKISRGLKQLAKELKVPIIALSQLTRDAAKGQAQIFHLRESGSLEQDADDVIIITPIADEAVMQDITLRDSIILDLVKHRDTAGAKIELKFVKQTQKILPRQDYNEYMNNLSYNNNPPATSNSKAHPPRQNKDDLFDAGFNSDTDDAPF